MAPSPSTSSLSSTTQVCRSMLLFLAVPPIRTPKAERWGGPFGSFLCCQSAAAAAAGLRLMKNQLQTNLGSLRAADTRAHIQTYTQNFGSSEKIGESSSDFPGVSSFACSILSASVRRGGFELNLVRIMCKRRLMEPQGF